MRWLRPEIQNPDGEQKSQTKLTIGTDEPDVPAKPVAVKVKKQKWPAKLSEQMQLLKSTLEQQPTPQSAADVAKLFTGGKNRAGTIEELLETLTAIGHTRQTDDGRYAI